MEYTPEQIEKIGGRIRILVERDWPIFTIYALPGPTTRPATRSATQPATAAVGTGQSRKPR
ncbi:MAG: hypothetical protein ACYTF6_12550 [Planctomycetota bacterium]